MDDLRELYQTTILDHNKKPRNFRVPDSANHEADGFNPLCGDKVTVYVQVKDGEVSDVGFQGSGCAISTASASMMTEAIKGKPVADALALFDSFHELVTSPALDEPDAEGVGKLTVFAGVREFPMRVKCATLAWHTLKSALEDSDETAKTE
ncbi:MAG: SUF system NifU family Fe-S cluster assembly protein [Deltaproteobacteria bacterium]|nr:SUF system NifU family Fe-S cluster assembly protein [Deltaproteobacteria bacterium]MBW2393933.1 SUF system NifU family Fe-S cluster assembly protein [Deltaproteobacteria bacterium]